MVAEHFWTLFPPHSILPEEGWFQVWSPLQKGNDKHYADSLLRLLTGSTNVEDDESEITSFLLDDADDDLLMESVDLNATMEFIENEFDESYQLLEIEERKERLVEKATMEELLSSQHNDEFCSEISRCRNRGEKLSFYNDDNGLLFRISYPEHKIVVPLSLNKPVLYLNHYPILTGSPRGSKLYNRIKHLFFLQKLTVHIYATVRNCLECPRERLRTRKNVAERKLSPAKGPNESIYIDIIGQNERTPRCHRYLLLITAPFTKLTNTVPVECVSAVEAAKHF